MVVHACNLSAGEVETGGWLPLFGHMDGLTWQVPGQRRDLVYRKKKCGFYLSKIMVFEQVRSRLCFVLDT